MVQIYAFIHFTLLDFVTDLQETKRESIFTLLRLPIVLIIGYLLIVGSGTIGFLDVSLSIFLTIKVGEESYI